MGNKVRLVSSRGIDRRCTSLVWETAASASFSCDLALVFSQVDPVLCETLPSAQLKNIYGPTGAQETSHVATVKNHMYVLCWTGVYNTYCSSN